MDVLSGGEAGICVPGLMFHSKRAAQRDLLLALRIYFKNVANTCRGNSSSSFIRIWRKHARFYLQNFADFPAFFKRELEGVGYPVFGAQKRVVVAASSQYYTATSESDDSTYASSDEEGEGIVSSTAVTVQKVARIVVESESAEGVKRKLEGASEARTTRKQRRTEGRKSQFRVKELSEEA